jgi:hypothetical protein
VDKLDYFNAFKYLHLTSVAMPRICVILQAAAISVKTNVMQGYLNPKYQTYLRTKLASLSLHFGICLEFSA